MFKIDIHVHTSDSSRCGKTSAVDMVNAYKNAGYDGMVITDHFITGNTTAPEDMPWAEKAHLMFEGYRNAKKEGDKIGVKVFGGFEYPDKGSDFLVFGLDEKFIGEHPEIEGLDVVSALKFFRENGGFVVHAHPMRINKTSQKKGIHIYPQHVDAIEVYNGAQGEKNGKFDPRGNIFAQYYADQTDLPQTGASDTHDANHMYGGGMIFAREPDDIFDVIEIIKSKKFAIFE